MIRKAVGLINRSERPIILCGHGVINSNAGQNLTKMAEKAHLPIAFTLHGLSALPVDHPLSVGMVGMHGTVEANRALLNSDLIISFGMRFDDRVTGNLATFGVDADVIHVEIDPSEIDKNVKTSVALNADVNQALTLLAKDPELITKPRRSWFEQIDKDRAVIADEISREINKGIGKDGQLLMKTIVKKLSDVTGGKDLIVSDVGQHQMILARFYNFQTVNSWFNSGGAGTMGCALPMAVGVKLARPDEQVWSISGDGGVPDEHSGTGCDYGARCRYQNPAVQQRVFGNGQTVANPVLRRPFRRNTDAKPRFRCDRRRIQNTISMRIATRSNRSRHYHRRGTQRTLYG